MNKKTSELSEDFLLESGRIFIRGEIDEETEEKLTLSLRHLLMKKASAAYIYINSEGGDVDSACAMIDEINGAKNSGLEVNTISFGKSYSAAAYLLTFGSRRYATENSTIMLHPILFDLDMDYIANQRAYTSYTDGKYDDIISKVARNCGKKTKPSIQKFRSEIQHGLWLSPREAKKLKVIDEIWDYSKESKIAY